MLKVQEIRELIKLIDQSSINEFTYETNGTTVSMKKGGTSNKIADTANDRQIEVADEVETVTQQPVVKQEVKHEEVTKEETKSEENSNSTNYDYEITSPMVGTFYRAPNPESDPYVEVGSKLNKDTVVCIVEAMKLFNEIEAEVSGEITEILVENGELVEYGQPLFRVKTK